MKGNFQIILMVIFVALAIFGILVFSGMIPIGAKNDPGSLGTVTIWGTERSSIIAPLLEDFNSVNTTFVTKYEQKPVETFEQNLIEALADGKGPDMVLIPDYLTYRFMSKIYPLPYTSYPLASFKTNFASAGDVFLNSNGILALPLSIDPLIMYYNRSTLDSNAIVSPPAYWDDLTAMVPTLTKKDDLNKITKSAVALGHFGNIDHAKDILTTLFMQTGNSMVTPGDARYISTLTKNTQTYTVPSMLGFFTDFADPSKNVYSWNRSFPSSKQAFSSESLAFYFGFASELPELIETNPNQNFAVAPMPQIKSSNTKATLGHVNGLAVLSSSKNLTTAFTAMSLMATGDFASKYASSAGLAPARRDLLQNKPVDSVSLPVVYNSALFAHSWLDPAPKETESLFSNMVEIVLSNILSKENAVVEADTKLNFLLAR